MWKSLATVLLVLTLLVPSTAQALDTRELLGLVAMPLAVAAVSEMTDVPMNDLVDVVSLLNDARVPPVQFVEVVRYVPYALVTEVEGPTFVEYVRLREREGLIGLPLINSIEDRLRVYNIPDYELNVTAPRVVYFDDDDFTDYIPPIVRTRVVESRSHPHGGPPGQIKKQIGVQTGAEVVHGSRPGKIETHRNDRVVQRDIYVDDRGAKADKPKHSKSTSAEKAHGKSGKGGSGKGHGNGKGKG